MPQAKHRSAWLAMFLEAQRIPPGSRLSLWLHGESAVGDDRRSRHNQGNTQWQDRSSPVVADPTPREPASQDRDQPSRNLLESPINFSRPRTYNGSNASEEQYMHPAFASPIPPDTPHYQSGKPHLERQKPKSRPREGHKSVFHSKDPRVQCKSIGTLVSGVLLTIVLTTCTFLPEQVFGSVIESPPDLAMATANAVPTTAFHVTFIFCVIVLTMVFAHFLIRLCMLTMRERPRKTTYLSALSQRRRPHRQHRHRRKQIDLEAGSTIHRPMTGNPGNLDRTSSRNTDDPEHGLTIPPPAYGWWRGSVRVDPEDLRHFDPDRSELQQQTRSLIFAGSGQRPPSYTSDPLHDEAERPVPLFHAHRAPIWGPEVREV